jgi:hypothetical protein
MKYTAFTLICSKTIVIVCEDGVKHRNVNWVRLSEIISTVTILYQASNNESNFISNVQKSRESGSNGHYISHGDV